MTHRPPTETPRPRYDDEPSEFEEHVGPIVTPTIHGGDDE